MEKGHTATARAEKWTVCEVLRQSAIHVSGTKVRLPSDTHDRCEKVSLEWVDEVRGTHNLCVISYSYMSIYSYFKI